MTTCGGRGVTNLVVVGLRIHPSVECWRVKSGTGWVQRQESVLGIASMIVTGPVLKDLSQDQLARPVRI